MNLLRDIVKLLSPVLFVAIVLTLFWWWISPSAGTTLCNKVCESKKPKGYTFDRGRMHRSSCQCFYLDIIELKKEDLCGALK